MSPDPPNILLITLDCLRYDRCGFNGYEEKTTPNLDKLASEGCVFDAAYATGPYTPESFPGILAGRHGYDSVIYQDPIWKALRENENTLASELQNEGYETFAVVTNPHLTEERNFNRGFQRYRNLRIRGESHEGRRGAQGFDTIERLLSKLRLSVGEYTPTSVYAACYAAFRYWQRNRDWPSVRGNRVVEEFEPEMKRATEPFFGWTHLMDAHAPIHPSVMGEGFREQLSGLYSDGKRSKNAETSVYSDMYDSSIKYIDQRVSDVLSTLKDEGLWENTIVIVAADHGEALDDRGIYGHPWHYMFDELLHVPLLLRVPDSVPVSLPDRVEEPFSLAWLHELITEIADIDGFDMASSTDRQSHLIPDTTPQLVSDSVSHLGHSLAIRDSSELLVIHYGERTSPNPVECEIMAPYTGQNLVMKDGDVVESTESGEIEAYVEELRTLPDSLPRIGDNLSQDAEDRLRELGYVN